jgi:hypothetical protein
MWFVVLELQQLEDEGVGRMGEVKGCRAGSDFDQGQDGDNGDGEWRRDRCHVVDARQGDIVLPSPSIHDIIDMRDCVDTKDWVGT